MLQSYTAVTMAEERTYVVKFDDGVEMKFELSITDETTRIECDGAWIKFNTPDHEDTMIDDIDNTAMALQKKRMSYFTVRVFIAWYLIIKECFPNIEDVSYTNRCVIDAIDDVSEKTKEELYESFKEAHWRLFYYYRLGFYVEDYENAEQYVNSEWEKIMDYDATKLQDYLLSDGFIDGPFIHCELMESGKKILENGVYSTRSKEMIKIGAELHIKSNEEESEEELESIRPNKRMRYSDLQLLVF